MTEGGGAGGDGDCGQAQVARVTRFLEDLPRPSGRRGAGASLGESERRFKELLEKLPRIAVQGYDRERRVIFWNDANEQVYGYTRAEALGRRLEDLIIPPAMRELVIESVRAWAEDGIPIGSGEIELERKDGSKVPVYSSHVMLRTAGGEPELYCIDVDLSAQRLAEQETRRLAYFDPLTGLPNRSLLRDRIQNLIAIARRASQPLALLYLDLDRFKNINDSLGHQVGDELLKEVSRRLQAAVREEDTVARLGGDEFILVLPNTAEKGAAVVAQKVISAVAGDCAVGNHLLSVTSSVGISVYPRNGGDFDALARAADTAMSRAKLPGRGGYQFFTPEMHSLALHALELESGLRLALERRELALHFQPQVDLASGRVIGAEALARWRHPEWGMVPPGEFIPVAEESGLILPLGDWVLEEAIRQAAAWHAGGIPGLTIAVNLSVIQLRQQGFLERVVELLQRHGLPPRFLEVEITESITMQEADHAVELTRSLHDAGIGLAIDDFGTGYSSLGYLKRFRANKLKIDRSFVQDVAVDADDAAIVDTIIHMGRTLGMQTIAEGVETREQLDFLRARGCGLAQGYLVGRPMPAGELESWYRSADLPGRRSREG